MLEFKIKSTIFIVEENSIKAIRLIDNRQHSFNYSIDGTVGELATRVNTILGINDSMFKEFSELANDVNGLKDD